MPTLYHLPSPYSNDYSTIKKVNMLSGLDQVETKGKDRRDVDRS